MRGINRVFLMGNVGQDPMVRHTSNGRAVCDLSVATHRGVRNGDTWVEEAEWHTVRLWERHAELALRYVEKGSAIAVEGALRTEQWTGKDGSRRQRTFVQVEQIHFLPRTREEGARPEPPAAPPAAAQGEEIPF